MGSFSHDLRQTLRILRRQPGFVVVAVASLALGIGFNTAIFSALNSFLLRPLAVRDIDRTVFVYHADPSNTDRGTSFRAFDLYRQRTEIFAAMTATTGARPLSLIDRDERRQVYGELVTSDYFAIVAARVQIGRPFDREIDRIVDPPLVAVLSHALWRQRFGSDPAIVGKPLNLNGRLFTITGVFEPGFAGLDPEATADVWIPMTAWAQLVGQPGRLTGDEHWLRTVATLREGVTLAQAQAAMAAAGLSNQPPAAPQTKVRPVREWTSESAVEAMAIGAAAFAAGLLVLTLACTNVANLLLARAAARQQEMAIRRALGASRSRLVRLWLTESLLLAVTGGLVGLVLASWMLDLVVAFRPPVMIGHAESPTLPIAFRIDLMVFAFALGLSVLTAMAIGALASLKTGRLMERRFAPGLNVRSAIIALQMALSMLLLIPCGLFVRSWLNASTIDPGFATENVLLLPIATDQAGVRVQKPPGFEPELLARVTALPGVAAATMMDPVPLWFASNNAWFSIENVSERVGHARVAPKYFETLRLPLIAGRDFTTADTSSAPAVAIVNETMGRRFWPGRSPLGRRITTSGGELEVVGVARDARYLSLADTAEPFLYRPLAQQPTDNLTLSLAVRTIGDPMQLRAAIEREVKTLVPGWPAFQFRTLDEGLELQQQLPRLGATLLAVLGGLGLLLASVGVYGVIAYVVKLRTREIGLRLALGSPVSGVLALVMKQGMVVCMVGAAIGLIAALVAARFLGAVLYGVGAADPLTFAAVPMLLFVVALVACYLPARQAARVNPIQALRGE